RVLLALRIPRSCLRGRARSGSARRRGRHSRRWLAARLVPGSQARPEHRAQTDHGDPAMGDRAEDAVGPGLLIGDQVAVNGSTRPVVALAPPPVPEDRGRSRRPLWIAFALNTVLLVAEIVGGIAAGSLALLADAAHQTSSGGPAVEGCRPWFPAFGAGRAREGTRRGCEPSPASTGTSRGETCPATLAQVP